MSSDPLFAKLKPGPGHSRKEVCDSQRARLEAALIEMVAKNGRADLTVRALARTSGVSTRTLYAHFASVDDCFVSAYRSVRRVIAARLAAAIAAAPNPGQGLRAAVRAVVGSAMDHPLAAAFALEGAYDGGPRLLPEIAAATRDLERQLGGALDGLPPPLSQAIVAGVEQVIRGKLAGARRAELPGLADELAAWAAAVAALRDRCPPGAASRSNSARRVGRRSAVGRADPGFAAFGAVPGARGRLLAAVARLAAADGYRSLTPTGVRREAGVSRRAFDALYDGVEPCYLEAGETLMAAAASRSVGSADGAADWPARVHRVAANFRAEVARSRLLVRLGFLDAYAAGASGLRSRERLLARAGSWLRAESPSRWHPGEPATEASLAAAWRLLEAEFAASAKPRPEAPSLLAQLILTASAGPTRQHVALAKAVEASE